ncbi:glycosyltransferase family 39 protein [Streptomyces sp. NPDC042319]|uniref:glycosyltransferase family 39 protein n=1 Tax=Streptomyces sp. NPDC042319 TaxID=3154332 RepID=UPI0033E911B6
MSADLAPIPTRAVRNPARAYRTTARPAPRRTAPTGERTALRSALVPVLPALLALALGCWGLTRQHSLWRDEAATWQAARRSVPEIWAMLGQVDVVHGLYYLCLHAVFALGGPGLVALRLPSVLAMAVAAAATAATGRRLAGPWTGLAAGLVLALIPNIQHYAQEGRAYALVTASVAVATWLLVRGAGAHRERPEPGARLRRLGRWAGYAAAVLCAALLNWFSLLVLPAHAVTVLLARRRGRRGVLMPWLVSAAVAVAGALPLVLASRAQAEQVSWIKPVAWTTLLGIAALVVIGFGCARVPYGRGHRAGAGQRPPALSLGSVALPLLVVPQAGLLLASLVRPLYIDRYVLFTNIGFALPAGLALAVAVRAVAARRHRLRTGVLLAGVTAVGFVALLPVETGLRTAASRVDDVLRPAELVAAQARAGDGVLFLPAARRDTALVSPAAFRGLDDLALREGPVAGGTLKGTEHTPARIRAGMRAHRRIVLVTDAAPAAARPVPAREAMKKRVLAEEFARATSTETRGRRVDVYVRKDS